MGSNEETIRLVQEAEKQRLFAQKVQQQNTHLTSQLELYKERNRILEGINNDNNHLNEFIKADERENCYNKQAQSQLVRDRDIIRDLEKQCDKLELDVKDHKRQKEEYQKTQTIFKQTQRDKEEKYLNDILQLQAKNKDLENIVCKMGRSTDTLQLLTNEQKAFRDNLHKSGLGYNGPYVLSQAYAKIPKLYRAYELRDKNEQLHVFDSEETLNDAEKNFVPQKELPAEKTYFSSSSISSVKIPYTKNIPSESPLINELDKIKDQVKPILNDLEGCLDFFQNLFQRDIKEMKDAITPCVFKSLTTSINVAFDLLRDALSAIFGLSELKEVNRHKVPGMHWIIFWIARLKIYVHHILGNVLSTFVIFNNGQVKLYAFVLNAFKQNDVYLDEIEEENDLLKDQLLEASLAEDIKNLVITSCMEIRNKDLHDRIERISQESKDVSNESKTADTLCSDAFEVTQGLSKRIVELEKDLSKSEAKSIAFEIALQHKSRENNSLKTVQKENENFMA
ncbi:hypothetical protein Tco_1229548 [Tanacetum coccineum]